MGEVNSEVEIPWGPGLTAQDAVFMAGGFKSGTALDQWIKIARRIELDSLNDRWEIAQVIKAESDSLLMLRAAEVLLEQGDVVMVYPSPTYVPIAMVRVEGPFTRPVCTPVRSKTEKAKDLLARSGGLNPFADKRSLVLIRMQQYHKSDLMAKSADAVAITSTGNQELDVNKQIITQNDTIALDWDRLMSGHKFGNFLLKDGDRLVVSEKSEIVTVQGHVNSKVIMGYVGPQLETYLAGAGGLTKDADKYQIYVRRVNGKNASTKRFLGIIPRYPRVFPGDRVVVPMKVVQERDGEFLGKWIGLTSALMSIVTAYTILYNGFK